MKTQLIKFLAVLIFASVTLSACSVEYRERHRNHDRDHHDDHRDRDHNYRNDNY